MKLLLQMSLWLLLLHCDSVKSEREIKSIYLNWNSTSDRSFLDSGSPLLTKTIVELFRSDLNYSFNPKFDVLAAGLHDEDNVYVVLEDINNIVLRLYEDLHPKYPNYAFNLTGLSIEKCENEVSCQKLTCDTGNIESKEQSDDKVVFVSWRKMNGVFELLLQHTNRLVSCNDTNNILNTEKLVIQGNMSQNVSPDGCDFSYTENISETLASNNFDLPANSSLHLGILQCLGCKITLKLNCDDNFSSTASVVSSRKIDFENKERSVPEWSEVSLAGPKKNSRCFLILVTGDQNEGGGSFWAITQRASYHQQDDEVSPSNSVFNFFGTTVFALFFCIIVFHYFSF